MFIAPVTDGKRWGLTTSTLNWTEKQMNKYNDEVLTILKIMIQEKNIDDHKWHSGKELKILRTKKI